MTERYHWTKSWVNSTHRAARHAINAVKDLPLESVGKALKSDVWDRVPWEARSRINSENAASRFLKQLFSLRWYGHHLNQAVKDADELAGMVKQAAEDGTVGDEKFLGYVRPIFGVAAVAICGVILFGTCSNNGSSTMNIGMPNLGQIGNVPGNVADGLLAQIPGIGDEAQQRINAEAAADAEAKRIADREQAIKDNKWNQMWADFMNNPFYRNITWCAREWCQNPLLQYQNRLGEHREISSFAFDGSEYKILLFPDFRMAMARMSYTDTENPHMFEMTDFNQIVSYLKSAGALESVNVDSIKDRLQLQIARQILKSKMGLPIERDGVHVVFDPLRKTYVQGTIPPEVKGDDYAIIRFLLREGKPGTVSDYAFARGFIGANERLPLPLDATWTVVTKETVLAHAQENQMYEFFTEKRGWFTHAALDTPYFFAMLDGAIGEGNPEFGIRPFGSGTPGSYVPGYTLSEAESIQEKKPSEVDSSWWVITLSGVMELMRAVNPSVGTVFKVVDNNGEGPFYISWDQTFLEKVTQIARGDNNHLLYIKPEILAPQEVYSQPEQQVQPEQRSSLWDKLNEEIPKIGVQINDVIEVHILSNNTYYYIDFEGIDSFENEVPKYVGDSLDFEMSKKPPRQSMNKELKGIALATQHRDRRNNRGSQLTSPRATSV